MILGISGKKQVLRHKIVQFALRSGKGTDDSPHQSQTNDPVSCIHGNVFKTLSFEQCINTNDGQSQ